MSVNSSNNIHRRSTYQAIGRAFGYAVWVSLVFIIVQFIVVGLVKLLAVVGVTLALTTPVLLALNTLIYALSFVVVVSAPLLVKGSKQWPKLEFFGLQRLASWSDIGLALLGVIPYIVLSLFFVQLATLFPGFDAMQKQAIGFTGSDRNNAMLAFIALVVVAPLAEEVLFRGYLFSKLRSNVGVITAIILTSITFAALHMQWNVAMDTLALSLVLCTLRVVTGSIWAGVILHMIKNSIAFFVLFMAPNLIH